MIWVVFRKWRFPRCKVKIAKDPFSWFQSAANHKIPINRRVLRELRCRISLFECTMSRCKKFIKVTQTTHNKSEIDESDWKWNVRSFHFYETLFTIAEWGLLSVNFQLLLPHFAIDWTLKCNFHFVDTAKFDQQFSETNSA